MRRHFFVRVIAGSPDDRQWSGDGRLPDDRLLSGRSTAVPGDHRHVR